MPLNKETELPISQSGQVDKFISLCSNQFINNFSFTTKQLQSLRYHTGLQWYIHIKNT